MELNNQNLVATGFDGATNMSGSNAGLCTLIKQNMSPKSIYVHCYCHKLNLALESACQKIPAFQESIETAKTLYAYCEGSAKRHHLFQHIQDKATKTTLKKLCETRWHHRYASFKAIKTSYTALLTFLSIQDDDLITKCGATASGLFKKIKKFQFIFYLEILFRCFKAVNILSETLQSIDMDIVKAQEMYQVTHNELVNMKFEFSEFYVDITTIAESSHVDILETTSHKRRRTIEGISTGDNKSRYNELHDEIVDTFLSKIDERFTEDNIQPVIAIYKMLVGYERVGTDFKDLEMYAKDVDFEALDMELTTWYTFKKIHPAQFDTRKVSELSKQFVNCHLQETLPQLFKFFKIYLSIPVTSTTGERTFSCLPKLKNYMRNTTEQQRLSHLVVLSIESRQMENVACESIVDEFAAAKNGRVKFY